jgi:flagellar biogenesis protein FliO
MMGEGSQKSTQAEWRARGLAGWLWKKLHTVRGSRPRLALLERIALAPRQSLALVEAEGRRFLVATSAEGAPAFYALDERRSGRVSNKLSDSGTCSAGRISW